MTLASPRSHTTDPFDIRPVVVGLYTLLGFSQRARQEIAADWGRELDEALWHEEARGLTWHQRRRRRQLLRQVEAGHRDYDWFLKKLGEQVYTPAYKRGDLHLARAYGKVYEELRTWIRQEVLPDLPPATRRAVRAFLHRHAPNPTAHPPLAEAPEA